MWRFREKNQFRAGDPNAARAIAQREDDISYAVVLAGHTCEK